MKPSIINNLPVIIPSWPSAPNIRAFATTRLGGSSLPPFDSFNLSLSSKDNINHALDNRNRLIKALDLPEAPRWLSQTHSIYAHNAVDINNCIEGDASHTQIANTVCAVMTADCLPILVCNKKGLEVAAIHAGWRGLLKGVIESTLAQLHSKPEECFFWLGPAISQRAFEVGFEVRDAFIKHDPNAAHAFINASKQNHYYADLYQLARMRLLGARVNFSDIYGGDYCTHSQQDWFYSYRRDGDQSGRMATLIWIAK